MGLVVIYWAPSAFCAALSTSHVAPFPLHSLHVRLECFLPYYTDRQARPNEVLEFVQGHTARGKDPHRLSFKPVLCPADSVGHPLSTYYMPRPLPLNHTVRLVRLVLSRPFSSKETEAQRCEATGPSSCGLKIESDSQTWAPGCCAAPPPTQGDSLGLGGRRGEHLPP